MGNKMNLPACSPNFTPCDFYFYLFLEESFISFRVTNTTYTKKHLLLQQMADTKLVLEISG